MDIALTVMIGRSPVVIDVAHDCALVKAFWLIGHMGTRQGSEDAINTLGQEFNTAGEEALNRCTQVVEIELWHIQLRVLAAFVFVVAPGVQGFVPLATAGLRHVLHKVSLIERTLPIGCGQLVQRALKLEYFAEGAGMANACATTVLVIAITIEEITQHTRNLFLGDDPMYLNDTGLLALVIAGQQRQRVKLNGGKKLVDDIAMKDWTGMTVVLEKLHK